MMDFFTSTLFSAEFWQAAPQVLWPLCRLLLSMMVALFAANMLEALNWTHTMARLAAPFVRSVVERVRRNQFKRVLPPIAKLSNRTIGYDFLYLRDWGT